MSERPRADRRAGGVGEQGRRAVIVVVVVVVPAVAVDEAEDAAGGPGADLRSGWGVR